MNSLIYYKRLAIPALVFAPIFTMCWMDKVSGFGPLAGTISILGFIFYAFYKLEIVIKRELYVYCGMILAYGISFVFNEIEGIAYYNRVALFIMTGAMLISAFYNDRDWGFGRQVRVIWDTIRCSFIAVAEPFKMAKESKEKSRVVSVIIALTIAVPLVLLVSILLMSADAIFGNMLKNMFADINFTELIRFIFKTIFMFFVAYCGMKALVDRHANTIAEKVAPSNDSIIGIIICGSVAIVYLMFSAVQILGLFTGNMTLPEGYTYSEYARAGFSQLLAVCVINLLIVIISRWCFSESGVLRIILVVICISTYIMLASSAFRMFMYVGAYGMTRLRFSTYAGLLTIAIFLGEIVVSIYKKQFHLYRYGLFTFATGYLILSACQMDYWIELINAYIL